MIDMIKTMDKIKLAKSIRMFVGVILSALMISFFRWALNAHFQIQIDTFFFKGASVFCLIILLLRRIDYKNWRLYVGSVGYIGYAVFYLITHDSGYGIEYREFLIYRFILRCLILLIVIDAFTKKENTQLLKQNVFYSILYLVTLTFCTAIKPDAMLHVLFPALVLFFTPISETNWKNFLLYFSCGYYLIFFIYTLQSLIENPQMSSTRYYFGNFGSPYGAGVLTMGALISALYMLEVCKDKLNYLLTILFSLLIIFPCFMTFLIGSRSIQLAAFMVVFLFFFMYEGKSERLNIRRRRAMLIGLGCILLIGAVIIFAVLKMGIIDASERFDFIGNEVLRNKLIYYVNRINGLLDTSSYNMAFEDGNKINILDHLLAGRVSIWYQNAKRITIWGNDIIEPVNGFGPHSIYVYWLVKFGWIGGVLLIASAIVGVVLAGKRLKTNRQVYLITFLWMVYYLAAGIGEQPFAEFDISVFFVVFQYPLLFQLNKEEMT